MRPPRSAEKVRELVATGEHKTMTAVAAAVGISRQRVHQLIRQYDIPWQDAHVRLEWKCPGCGREIRVSRYVWEHKWNHMPAHCRACHLEDRNRFCIRGHLRIEEETRSANSRYCRACARLRESCVIDVRVCEGCQQPLKITIGMHRQALYGHAVNKHHRSCWMRKLGGRRPTPEERAVCGAKIRASLQRKWAGLTPEQHASWSAKLIAGRARWRSGLTAEQWAAHNARVQASRRTSREQETP